MYHYIYMSLLIYVAIIIFLLGLIFYARHGAKSLMEGFTSTELSNRCPNILIQKDKNFYLHNSKQAIIPGVNPIKFDNLEDYVEFLDWQRSKGIR